LANIDGQYPRPVEIEALWSRIQENRLPDAWLKVSFQTARRSLADYLVELGLKLEFWKKIVAGEAEALPSYWLPAFFDPKSFLGALIQTRARDEGIPMHDLKNEFEILNISQNEERKTERNVAYLHGLSLDGATWDAERKLVVDSTSTARFAPFPALKVRTVRLPDARTGVATPEEQAANYNANAAKKKGKRKKKGDVEEIYEYKCPIYTTTLRLSTGLISKDNAPVAFIKLPTTENPSKWIKRSVALILEGE
jgi:hypothetical protein